MSGNGGTPTPEEPGAATPGQQVTPAPKIPVGTKVALAVLAAALIVLVLPVWAWIAPTPAFTRCTFPNQPRQGLAFRGVAGKLAKLVLINGQTTALTFNRSLTTKTLTIQYGIAGSITDVTRGYPNLKVDQGDFLRSDQVALPAARVSALAWYENGRVLLKLCVNRSGQKLADPGIYQGTVSIVDPRVARVDVPITVSLSYPDWQWVLELLVLAAFAGSWYIWVLQEKDPSDRAISWNFVTYCFSMIGVLSIGAGVIAALGVYEATYLSSDSWGASAGQPISLLGAMFTAFLAGTATVHVGAKAGAARTAHKEAKAQLKAASQAGEGDSG